MPHNQSPEYACAQELLALLGHERKEGGDGIVVYRPIFRQIVKHTSAALLLNQMLYYYVQKSCQPFYKFIQPCSHPLYREGDSWTELLGWSYSEFSTAIGKIATKVTTGTSKVQARQEALVIYWTNSSNVTYYEVMVGNLVRAIIDEVRINAPGNSLIAKYLSLQERLNLWRDKNPELPSSTESPTEHRTEGSAVSPYVDEGSNQTGEEKSKHDPLVRLILGEFRRSELTRQEQRQLEKKIVLNVRGEPTPPRSLADHYWHTPGFEPFVHEVVQNLAAIPGFGVLGAIRFLQIPSKPGTKTPHWDEWCEANPQRLKLRPEVQYAHLKEGEIVRINRDMGYMRRNGEIVRCFISARQSA